MSKKVPSHINEKVKVLVIAGFLGSGKTTLLRNILYWEKDLSDTVVIVNELGKVGIDGALLRKGGSDVFELTSGCVCCTIRTELARTLRDVCDRYKPKRILLEATGVAEPNKVASALEDGDLKQSIEINQAITVLDIKYWIGKENFGQFFMNQLAQADLILLNKIDTVDKKKVWESLKEIHETVPGSHAVPTIYCKVDPEILWADGPKKVSSNELLGFYLPAHGTETNHEYGHCHYHNAERNHAHLRDINGFVAFDFLEIMPLDETSLKRFLEKAPWGLFRIKGPVRFPDRTLLLNFVCGRSEWETWDGDQDTRLAFVGWGVNGHEVIEQLKRCVLAE
ncbi:MAG: GTP-binding protein [Desulfobacteraceae bacterium]|nr:MAG: GTP-binding protein [Desulfobacteraceae bacterium]